MVYYFVFCLGFKSEIMADSSIFSECYTRRVCHIHQNSRNPCVPKGFGCFLCK